MIFPVQSYAEKPRPSRPLAVAGLPSAHSGTVQFSIKLRRAPVRSAIPTHVQDRMAVIMRPRLSSGPDIADDAGSPLRRLRERHSDRFDSVMMDSSGLSPVGGRHGGTPGAGPFRLPAAQRGGLERRGAGVGGRAR